MLYLAIAAVICTAIASAAYVYPKAMFLALQGEVVARQEAREAELSESLLAGMNETGVPDSGSYI